MRHVSRMRCRARRRPSHRHACPAPRRAGRGRCHRACRCAGHALEAGIRSWPLPDVDRSLAAFPNSALLRGRRQYLRDIRRGGKTVTFAPCAPLLPAPEEALVMALACEGHRLGLEHAEPRHVTEPDQEADCPTTQAFASLKPLRIRPHAAGRPLGRASPQSGALCGDASRPSPTPRSALQPHPSRQARRSPAKAAPEWFQRGKKRHRSAPSVRA